MTISRRAVLAYGAGTASVLAVPSISRAQAAPIRLVFSHHLPTTNFIHKTTETFAARVKDGTNGQVTIDIRPASQLFNLRSSAEALQVGTLDLTWTDMGTLSNWIPHLGFMSMPFLFNDLDHVKRVMYGPPGKQIAEVAKESLNVEVLAMSGSGFRVFLSKKPIHKADDVRGIRLRVPEIPSYVEMAKAIGANPTPIPLGEVYTALQTGVIDAVELPAEALAEFKLYEVAGFATRTNHVFSEVSMMASSKKMAALPANVQKIIRDEAARTVQKEMWEALIAQQRGGWDELAGKVKGNATPDIESFRSKMQPVITNFINKTGPKGKALIDACNAAAKA